MIHIVGLSHKTAPVALREELAFSRESVREALLAMREQTGALEAMILSTCNRVELYARAEEPDASSALSAFLCGFHQRSAEALAPHLYSFSGAAAVHHAFRVASSLESMVIGEPQILGQVKQAYLAAEEAGTLGPVLAALRARSVSAARRARAETGIGAGAVSISYVAVELARKIFGQLTGRSVLLVGAGKMSELAARHLVNAGARAAVLGGRTLERAAELASSLGGRALPLERLREEMARADIVISGTGAPGLVIKREDVEAARAARHNRPLFLIDIAVPRDIEASAGRMEGVFLYDVDDLRSVAEANLRERRKEASAAEALVEKEARDFLDWEKSLEVVPLLVELRQRAEEVRRGELEKVRGRLGPLSAEQEQALEAATTAMVNKLLHAPTVHLKEAASNGDWAQHVTLIRKLLGL